MLDPEDPRDDWRRDLRAKITWALAVKLAALMLLWFLFFRGDRP
jgi:hypothetical protein